MAYHATSIQEIVDTAGIAKGSLYFYFKSKEDLLLSLLKYYYDLLRSTINIISQDTISHPGRDWPNKCWPSLSF
ncbi:TetR/AcrR family transcriptional regulator [Paenibacillus larvae]|nr:TetR/AcrR family transcriptional regulator [Paenibacillus larvae]MCY9679299.1 TetR/AcrR family transcriptional regulator [Paenibacillus larvae]MCY9745168.1 TetR/AcrR family transcriptional regulator [Paenibacillus larvae]MCY9750416.1 TetR/AcrR family transcriptional regulator [Paenibacillus larvae]